MGKTVLVVLIKPRLVDTLQEDTDERSDPHDPIDTAALL